MRLIKKLILLFFIGFSFRLFLELLFPYSAIGFDQMGYYVPMLYTKANPLDYFSVGFIYYLIASGINSILNNPLLTIKLLDSIVSGIFILSLFAFSEYGVQNRYSFYISIFAFFSFQSLILDWSLQRNILAFSIFLFTFVFRDADRKNILCIILLLIVSGFTDPAIIPLEFFWFLYLTLRNRKYLPAPLTLIALTFILIISATFTPEITGARGNELINFTLSFFFSGNLIYDMIVYTSLSILLFAPFVIFIPLLRNYDYRKDMDLKIPIVGTFIFSSLAVFSFFSRYLIELSVISILFIKEPKRYIKIFSLFLVLILLISSSYIMMDNYYPSPYFYNGLTKSTNINEIVSTSFLQSTVPLNDSKIIVKLFSYVRGNDSLVISMLYMVSFAYEAGIKIDKVINTDENYTLFLNKCEYYYSLNYTIYTVWWYRNGWYGIESLPSSFVPVKIIGNYALFVYEKN
ncbi:MAG: hypothetical protein F9Y92_00150 [Thermoplasmatales archaeon]|jgi:hypothetical protein|nr:hypothetical protein [Thermoplasmatales archaeon]